MTVDKNVEAIKGDLRRALNEYGLIDGVDYSL